MSKIKPVHSDEAPKAVGPYSQAIRHGDVLYLSGQIGLDPVSGSLAGDTVEIQARQVMQNLSAVLRAGGAAPDDIIKANIYLVDMADFPKINAIYAEWLGSHRPARATVAVAALPLGAKVEIDLIARIP
ncbi:MAG TPA: Rid family detoxifying hydrolase [Mariprofundaceae bacterium]|nr:Rid family detoxifying hydrolase [Mariprofundaceae bacterium]